MWEACFPIDNDPMGMKDAAQLLVNSRLGLGLLFKELQPTEETKANLTKHVQMRLAATMRSLQKDLRTLPQDKVTSRASFIIVRGQHNSTPTAE